MVMQRVRVWRLLDMGTGCAGTLRVHGLWGAVWFSLDVIELGEWGE